MVGRSLSAADLLKQEGIDAGVLDVHTVKPIDKDLIISAASQSGAVVTAEEHTILGGLGSAVAEVLGEGLHVQMLRVGIHDAFAKTGPDPEAVMDACGMGVADIAGACRAAVAQKRK
jgi:transketolase